MRDGLKDLSTITTIPYHTLQKLFEKFSWVICDSVQESCMNKQDYASIDIGIGTIDIAVVNDSVQYRFIPSSKLEESVKDTIINKHNPLVSNVEEALVKRVVNAYKDFF